MMKIAHQLAGIRLLFEQEQDTLTYLIENQLIEYIIDVQTHESEGEISHQAQNVILLLIRSPTESVGP